MRPAAQVGATFAGYLLEEVLGRGGMSEVYRARNPRLGNAVALKLLDPELAKDDLFRERFARESQIAASLDHPNVISIYDAGEADGVPYIAMRYVAGPTLAHLLERAPLTPEQAVAVVAQVAAALDCAHEQGLIHRDVKPANILVDKHQGVDVARHVYLSDFGVAKHTLSRSGLTSTGQFVGTIDYVAPEQIEGKEVDRRTDVYSLGCVLYECLTAAKPFERESNVAVMYAHLLEPPPAVTAKRPELPAALDAVVAKAMAKKPDARYSTSGELAAAAKGALTAVTAPTAAAPAPAEAPSEEPEPVPVAVLPSMTMQVARPLEPPATEEPPPTAPTRGAFAFGGRRIRGRVLVAVLGLAVAGLAAGAAAQTMFDGRKRPPPPPTTDGGHTGDSVTGGPRYKRCNGKRVLATQPCPKPKTTTNTTVVTTPPTTVAPPTPPTTETSRRRPPPPPPPPPPTTETSRHRTPPPPTGTHED